MIKEEQMQFRRAYVELFEVLSQIPKEQYDKIPLEFIDNLKTNMDTTYEFEIDKSKSIYEQNIMLETKALLVEMYIKFLAPAEENEFWNNYHLICSNIKEEQKRNTFNPDNIFQNENQNVESNIEQKQDNKQEKNDDKMLIVQKKSFFNNLIESIKIKLNKILKR